MATTIPGASIALANSTTYIDLLGLLLGLARLPGETSYAFAARLETAAVAERTAGYIGLMNELCLQLGFRLQQAIEIGGVPAFSVSVDLSGVHLSWTPAASQTPPNTLTCRLMTIGPDVFWEWRLLSDIVADINATGSLTATLLIEDGPAFQLAAQSNQQLVLSEPVSGQVITLAHSVPVASSISFNQSVSAYSVSDTDPATLIFDDSVPAGTSATYQYVIAPYYLVASPVFMFSLADPLLPVNAVNSQNQLVYQVKEFVQEIVTRDGSYWAV